MTYIAYIKTPGLRVHEKPNGKPIDTLDPHMWLQIVGTPTITTATVEWIEVAYWRPREPQQRGWVRKDMLNIQRDPQFPKGETVHEAQAKYEKSVSFPKPAEPAAIDLRDALPECTPIPFGIWFAVGFAALLVVVFLTKLLLHII